MAFVYLDTETTGLEPGTHEVWEIAYAIGDNPIASNFVAHVGVTATQAALDLNGYATRGGADYDPVEAADFEAQLIQALEGNTLVAANPAFDAAFLRARWGRQPWKYRLLDIEAYAMGALGYDEPKGLKTISDDLRALGYDMPKPNHTAAADVLTLRTCHAALRDVYAARA